ncbi:type I-C CRISPR-associated protein Cas7/Csd2 [Desulfosporosinus metallidurans]|uniref:CRISPR-associated protein, Csd2/Csh2 family n=1 Tax=Desulfosporosinus metallidurans TaxID=1888891 RepID=A0A1Q8QMC2_9FIRM|nr:type I-C CRISPR-associated protein Cas7/Csd2 [Desulfosporosinus metallidurans]OLN28491.1 CRISPR-associated protein, Csd2/Csh2 family [Desulfosporosinus metallidurans]
MDAIKKRYEFVLLFDVENGNPNGDPDAGNMPRIDAETGLGLVTDVCLKRKIRNYVDIAKNDTERYDIYVREGSVLNTQHRKAYKAMELEPESKKLPKEIEQAKKLTHFMCHHFFDVRTFGAVMSTEVNCGVVRGPVQINFARSIDPIIQQEVTITRMAVTSEKDAEKKDREMGRKFIVPYALYRVEGYISAFLADKTGFSEDDLELFWEALTNMFDHDHSAARGKMSARKLIVFEHETALGNAPAHKLFDLLTVSCKDPERPTRSFNDYEVSINHTALPAGVKLIEK